VSFTTRPKLVQDQDTKEHLVDCPGFEDTRKFYYDIASTFFTNMLLNGTKELKILAVIHNDSLKSNRKAVTSLLEHLTTFLSKFEVYRPSIGLVVTNLAISNNATQEKKHILNKLEIIKREQVTKPEYVRLIELFMRSEGKGIGIFHRPPTTGRLHKIPEMAQDLRSLRHLVFEDLRYTTVNTADFRMTIADSTKLVVERMVSVLENRIKNLITDVWKGTLPTAELPKDFDLREANEIFNQFWAVNESLQDQRNGLSDIDLTRILLRNNLKIDQQLHDTLERQKKSQRLLLDLLQRDFTPHYVDKAQVENSFGRCVHQLAGKILSKCKLSMTDSTNTLLTDFSKAYEAKVAENRDVKLAKQLLKNLLKLKQKIATYTSVNFTVPVFETEMKRCIQFPSQALAPLRDAEKVLLNVQKVSSGASAWAVLESTIAGDRLSANTSAWRLYRLLNERIDHHVEALSGAVENYFLVKYRRNDRWFQKSKMKQPLATLEPIIAGEYRNYKSFLKNVTDWTEMYNSTAYTEPLTSLQLLKPDANYLLNLKDVTVALPKRHKWAKKLQGATGYMRNSASRPRSPINTLFRWISGQSQMVFQMMDWRSSHKTHLLLMSTDDESLTHPFSGYDLNSSLLLFDVLLRKFFKTKHQSESGVEMDERWHAQANALNIVAECEALGGRSFDYAGLQQDVMQKLLASSSDQVHVVREEALAIVKGCDRNNVCSNLFSGCFPN
jgi:hypothetical protein